MASWLKAVVIVCRIIAFVYSISIAGSIYWVGNIDFIAPVLNLYAPQTTAVAFLLIAIVNAYELLAINRHPRKRRRRRHCNPIMNMYDKYLGDYGLFGRAGALYEWRLIGREILEM